jgi:hypothetical protein
MLTLQAHKEEPRLIGLSGLRMTTPACISIKYSDDQTDRVESESSFYGLCLRYHSSVHVYKNNDAAPRLRNRFHIEPEPVFALGWI